MWPLLSRLAQPDGFKRAQRNSNDFFSIIHATLPLSVALNLPLPGFVIRSVVKARQTRCADAAGGLVRALPRYGAA